ARAETVALECGDDRVEPCDLGFGPGAGSLEAGDPLLVFGERHLALCNLAMGRHDHRAQRVRIIRKVGLEQHLDRSQGGFGLLAHLATPGEQLRMAQPMPPRYRAVSLVTGIALRDDRRFNIVIPDPPSPRAGEDLQPLKWPSASIIT